VSLFDFVASARKGERREDASGAAAAEKLREEFNSLLAGDLPCISVLLPLTCLFSGAPTASQPSNDVPSWVQEMEAMFN
jgi:hypothetical protein